MAIDIVARVARCFGIGFHAGASTVEILKIRPNAQIKCFDPSKFSQSCYEKHCEIDDRTKIFIIVASNQ